MPSRIKLNRTLVATVFGALLATGLGWFLQGGGYKAGLPLENWSYDWLTVARGDLDAPEAVVVYLDEESHQKLGQSLTAAWDRTVHAQLIDRLTAAGAKAIVFDIVFNDADT